MLEPAQQVEVFEELVLSTCYIVLEPVVKDSRIYFESLEQHLSDVNLLNVLCEEKTSVS